MISVHLRAPAAARIVAGLRAAFLAALIVAAARLPAQAVPVFANGQGVSCELCHTTFPGMTRYGMSVMMTNFQILNRHLQDSALPVSARLYITSLLANKSHPASTTVSDLSLLAGGFLGRNFTWYLEQHVIDSGVIGQTEQSWISWNGLLGGTNSLQLGKFHTPFPFMPAHAWTISPYLLAAQTTGENPFNPNDARWGLAFNGMTGEWMYNLSWLAGSGPMQDALDYNRALNPRTLDANVSYGGMSVPWNIGLVAMKGISPVTDPASNQVLYTNAFTREGVYFGYQTSAWHYQTMYYHGMDVNPSPGLLNVPLNGFFFEAERDLDWQNHILLRYDVASSDTLNRQFVIDVAHNVLPNLAFIGELAAYPGARPQIAFQLAYAGPYQYGKRYLANFHVVPGNPQAMAAESAPAILEQPSPSPATPTSAGDVNAGAALVQANGCAGCHGANFRGGSVGPALCGIEHRLTPDQIADFITHPRAPMPNFGFSATQVQDVVAYLSSLDGGGSQQAPVITVTPPNPVDTATVSVRFAGTPPQSVSVLPIMQMGASTMSTRVVHLLPSRNDPHLFAGRVVFSMGGPWTLQVQYDGKHVDYPLTVGP
jgi:mono/diheme cytochrome c family protein